MLKLLLAGAIVMLTQACSGAEVATQTLQANQVSAPSSLNDSNSALQGSRDSSDDDMHVNKKDLSLEDMCARLALTPEAFTAEEKARCPEIQ